mmetsp:Transcript_43902/g.65107  ORF Transcript_43902/g.65107 Transcript_43902/m.65107 type:complete len:247 (-) Transcript_43902:102-842(-)
MPPFAVNTECFHAAPIGAFPSGYVEILTSTKNGKVVVSDIAFMGMNLEQDDQDVIATRPRLENANPAEEIYETLTDNLWYACGPGGVCVVDDVPTSRRGLRPILKKSTKGTTKSALHIFSKKSVRFHLLHIRTHTMTLGDHPSAVSGPPITLDWKTAADDQMVDLDTYERGREPRRNRRQLKMSFHDREDALIQEGFTVDQVKAAWEQALQVRRERYETLQESISGRFDGSRGLWGMFRSAVCSFA